MKITIHAPGGDITNRALAVILALYPGLTAGDVASEVLERFFEQGMTDAQFLQETGQAVTEGIQRKKRRARRTHRTGKAVRK